MRSERDLGFSNELGDKRLVLTVGVNVLPELERQHLGLRHLLVEELNDDSQLPSG